MALPEIRLLQAAIALAEELKPLALEPGMFLRKLNSDLCSILKSTGSSMLTTAFYLVANWQTGMLRYANAGHPKPLLVNRFGYFLRRRRWRRSCAERDLSVWSSWILIG